MDSRQITPILLGRHDSEDISKFLSPMSAPLDAMTLDSPFLRAENAAALVCDTHIFPHRQALT